MRNYVKQLLDILLNNKNHFKTVFIFLIIISYSKTLSKSVRYSEKFVKTISMTYVRLIYYYKYLY